MRPVSVFKNLTPATKTTLATVPTKYDARWVLLHAHNGTASAKKFTAWVYDKSQDAEIPIIFQYPLAASGYLEFGGSGQYVVLEEGDEIRVEIETGASNASCIITLELYPKANITQFQDFGD